jgi:pimeloyl-[acyl-carrier protein] methyl ester esterase
LIITPSKINIEVIGSGPNLVLIHGWGMNSAVWKPLVKKLSKTHTLHLIDLPGMGYSQTILPYHLYSIAEQISELLPNDTDMVGWSLGGQVAMRIALDQPEVVKKLVLVGSTPCFVNVSGITTQTHWQHGIDQDVFEQFSDNVAKDYQKTIINFLTLQCMGSRSAGSTIRFLRGEFATQPEPVNQVLQSALNILLETDLRKEISSIDKPTLIIHGDKDTLAPVQAANWMAQQLPEALLRVISGASHAPFLSHEKEFTDALLSFLRSDVVG